MSATESPFHAPDQSYRVIWHQAVTVSTSTFIEEFPEEWADAQRRGLSENEFAIESIRACDFETLVDIGSNPDDNFDWEPL